MSGRRRTPQNVKKSSYFRRNAASDSDTVREQTSESMQTRTRQSKAKAEQKSARKRQNSGRCERNSTRELIETRSSLRRSCRAPQSRIQPEISRDWASFDRFKKHRSTESFEKQKSKTSSLLVTPVPVFVCLRSRPAASRGALCRCCKRGALAWTSQQAHGPDGPHLHQKRKRKERHNCVLRRAFAGLALHVVCLWTRPRRRNASVVARFREGA